MKEHRKTVAQELLNRYSLKGMISSRILQLETNPGFIIVTRKKRQSMEYDHPGSPSVKKLKTVPSTKKFMLIIFWDTRDLLYTEYLTKGSTVNSDRCLQPYDHSCNAPAESGRRYFCIKTTQGHIAVHKLRTP